MGKITKSSSWPESMKSQGLKSYQRELEDIGLENIPQYLYEDETQNKQTFPQLAEELEPTPEVGDHYIGAEILLGRGDKMARGHVVMQIHDANENLMGRADTNPILNTMTELTTNIIAESIYTQCYVNGNEYLLLDALFAYCKDNNAISPIEEQTSIWGRSVTHMTTAGWQITASGSMVLPHWRSCPS